MMNKIYIPLFSCPQVTSRTRQPEDFVYPESLKFYAKDQQSLQDAPACAAVFTREKQEFSTIFLLSAYRVRCGRGQWDRAEPAAALPPRKIRS